MPDLLNRQRQLYYISEVWSNQSFKEFKGFQRIHSLAFSEVLYQGFEGQKKYQILSVKVQIVRSTQPERS